MTSTSSVLSRRFTRDEYHRLIDLGFFSADDRVELIRGELIQMAAKGIPHAVCNTALNSELVALFKGRAVIRNQEPIVLPSDSEPEPDFVIARLRPDNYTASHPYPTDVLLVIEVSDSTLTYDQTTKLSLYAEDGIEHYWIVNLKDYCLECYSQPYRTHSNGHHYRCKQVMLPSETIEFPGFPGLLLDLNLIFPRM